MSSYNQRKKKEALRRLSQGRSRSRTVGGNEPTMRQPPHHRAHTGNEVPTRQDVQRMMPAQSTVSPLERSEVQGHSATPPTLFGKATPVGLFGKVAPSSTSGRMFPSDPPAAVTTGLFGKADGPSQSDIIREGSSGDLPQREAPITTHRSESSLFGRPSVPGEVSRPSTAESDSTTTQVITLFGKKIIPQESASSSIGDRTTKDPTARGLFGKPGASTNVQQHVSSTRMLFGKPGLERPVDDKAGVRAKVTRSEGLFGKGRLDLPQRSFGGSKRTLVEMEEESASGRDSDLSDLETFGSFGGSRVKTADSVGPRTQTVKVQGLFGKAVEDIEGKKKRRSEEVDSEARKQKKLSVSDHHRTASQEEIKQITSIVCKDIPPALNLRGLLVDIFKEYGQVVKVSCQPENQSAIIYFADHSSASRAKRRVKQLRKGTPPVSIYWASPKTKSAKSERAKPPKPSLTRSPTRGDGPSKGVPPTLQSDVIRERGSVSPARRALPAARAREQPPAVSSSQSKIGSKAVKAALTSLEGRVAHSASERLEVLEERDRLKRQERTLDQGSVPTLGAVCEDMCPEKERYMREFQRRLSVYEVQNVGAREQRVSHPAAIKEYSRSSADQELPLPTDLRPPAVLAMTMDYLMNNIMDKGLGEDGHSWGEWYTFLWDRTRSIRKDITQQQLCDTTAVDLLEKCTRFHIFCAHRLCEEDTMNFDPKINSENLTKCLQSLKHLYDDLANKGVTCPTEAEFRAYDVLLNINQGDILRQVQNYRSEVCNSELIRFAVQCVSAVSSQNYVRFFKLVRSGTYLNDCVIHRYFTQVRNTAIEIISRAFSSNRGTPYPITEIVRLLAFENEKQATVFCEAHGLTVSNGIVTLSRSDFLQPDSVISPIRSISIIEAKNQSLIGEVVNGGPLPLNLRHLPASSFDDQGRFSLTKVKQTDSGALDSQPDQHREEDVTVRLAGPVVAPSQEPSPAPALAGTGEQYSIVDIRTVAKDIFFEVIDEAVSQVSRTVLSGVRRLEAALVEVSQEVLAETTTDLIKHLGEQTITTGIEEDARRTELQRKEQARRIAEREVMVHKLSEVFYQGTLTDVLHQELWQLTAAEKRLFEAEQRAEQLEQQSGALTQEYLKAVVLGLSREISKEIYEDELRLRDEALAEIEEKVHRLQQARYLEIWRKAFTKRLRLKDTIETFPAGPSTNDIATQLREFVQVPKTTTLGADWTSFESVYKLQRGVAASILKRHHHNFLNSKELWAPYDIPTLSGDLLSGVQASADHLFWKLLVSLPSSPKTQEFALFSSWLKAKLRRGYIPEKLRKVTPAEDVEFETCSLYSTRLDANGTVASVCTKVISGSLPSSAGDAHSSRQIRDALTGAQGVILVLEAPDIHGNKQSYWAEQKKRLLRLLTGKPKYPGLPLLVVFVDDDPSPAWQGVCQGSLDVASLQAEGLVSDVTYSLLTGNLWETNLADQVVEDLQWLAARCPISPKLESCSLPEFVDNGLTNFFSLQVRENEKFRREAKMAEEGFDTVIGLYNAVIKHLISCSTGVRLKQLSWPPTEFTTTEGYELPVARWNDSSNLAELQKLLSSLILPEMGDAMTDSWEDIRECCLLYVKGLRGTPHEKLPLISRVTWLLERCQREFEGVCLHSYQTGGCSMGPDVLPWTSLAETCIEYVVGLLKQRSQNDDDGLAADRMVYYFKGDFDGFRVPQRWLETTCDTLDESVLCPQSIDSSYLLSVEERQHQMDEVDVGSETLEDAGDDSKWATQTFVDLPASILAEKEVDLTARKLDKLLATEREESDRYEEYLQGLLEDSPVPDRVESRACYSDPPLGDDTLLSQKLERLEAEMNLFKQSDRTINLRLETIVNL